MRGMVVGEGGRSSGVLLYVHMWILTVWAISQVDVPESKMGCTPFFKQAIDIIIDGRSVLLVVCTLKNMRE